MSDCQFRTKPHLKNGVTVNCCDKSDKHETSQNGQDIACEKHENYEVKTNSKSNQCTHCSDKSNTKNMCDHSNEHETCKFHSRHGGNGESNFGDGYTNIRCKFCWYINRMHNSEIKEAQRCFQTHIKCMYCANDISIKHLVPKSSLSHPYCKGCQATASASIPGSFSHTDCKYCQSGCKSKKPQRKGTFIPHTDCRYCHDAGCDSADYSFEDCNDLCPMNERYVPCLAHDAPYKFSGYYPQHSRAFPYKQNYHFCEDSSDMDHVREALQGMNLSSSFCMNENIGTDCMDRPRFRSCEYCIKNGESPVIYNSHQFQNASGVVTCPLIRQYGTVKNFHYCPYNNEDFQSKHNHDAFPHNNGWAQHNLPDVPRFYHKRTNGRRFRYTF